MINNIDGAPVDGDKQIWSIRMSDLSVIERTDVANGNTDMVTIDEQGNFIWCGFGGSIAGYGNSTSHLVKINAMDLTSPTILLFDTTTLPSADYSCISKRLTRADEHRNHIF